MADRATLSLHLLLRTAALGLLLSAAPDRSVAQASNCLSNLYIAGSIHYAAPGCTEETYSSIESIDEVCCGNGCTDPPTDIPPAPPPATSCTDLPLRRARVELELNGSLFLVTETDENGEFGFCVQNNDPSSGATFQALVLPCADGTLSGDACGTLAGVSQPWSVAAQTGSGTLYLDASQATANVCTGSLRWDIYDRRSAQSGAFHNYDLIANDVHDRLVALAGWTNEGQLKLRFPDTFTGFTPDGVLHVAQGDEQDPDVVLSSFGLYTLYELGGQVLPPVDCTGHGWNLSSSAECAWLFGWSDFLQGVLQDDNLLQDTATPGGPPLFTIDIEAPSPGSSGSRQDGAVAASLWDLWDVQNDAPDAVGHAFSEIWSVVEAASPDDVCEFRDAFRNAHDLLGAADPIYANHGIEHCGLHYAALGDSYSSGEGVPPYDPLSDIAGTNVCHRSTAAYSSFVRVPGSSTPIVPSTAVDSDTSFEFLACSGAVTDNVRTGGSSPQAAIVELAQLDRLTSGSPGLFAVNDETNLVTITIGGNDARFAAIVKVCVIHDDCRNLQPRLSQGDARTLLELFPELVDGIVKPRLQSLYQEIIDQAGNAAVVVLGYPYLMGGFRDCDDARFHIPFLLDGRVSMAEQQMFRSFTDTLNGAIGEAAATVGVHFVPNVSYDPAVPGLDQRFGGHELCGYLDPPWMIPLRMDAPTAAHPTGEGHRAWGETVNDYFERKVAFGWSPGFHENGLPRNPAPIAPAAGLGFAPAPVPSVDFGELVVEPAATQPCPAQETYLPGESVRLTATGLMAFSPVEIELVDTVGTASSVAGVVADADGALDVAVVLPASIVPPTAVLVLAHTTAASGGPLMLIGRAGIASSFTTDGDGDGVPDVCDNCLTMPNAGQLDADLDGAGDACDPCAQDAADDTDGDGLCANVDPCPFDPANDFDLDGICGDIDNCAIDANPSQDDGDGDGRGDVCDATPCHDVSVSVRSLGSGSVQVNVGTCGVSSYQSGSSLQLLATPSPGFFFTGWTGDVSSSATSLAQSVTSDIDIVGNFCTTTSDSDGDLIGDACDNCLDIANVNQGDTDNDLSGNACDCDFNNDGLCDITDFSSAFLPDFIAGQDSGVGTDMNGDGVVDINDYGPFLTGFLAGVPGPSGLVP